MNLISGFPHFWRMDMATVRFTYVHMCELNMTKKCEKTILAYSTSNNSRNSGSGFSHKEILFKTVQIEIYAIFFQSLGEKNKKQKFDTRNPGDPNGHQWLWLFLLPVGHPRPFCSRKCVYRAMGDAPATAGAIKIEQGVVYNPTIHHGYLLETNRHPGRRQP